MPAPRPKYNDPEKLQELIDEYFELCGEKPTVSGLAYHLDFASRQSIYQYAERADEENECFYIIKKTLLRIESMFEAQLWKPHCGGAIFWLKNKGWTDVQQIDHSFGGFYVELTNADKGKTK